MDLTTNSYEIEYVTAGDSATFAAYDYLFAAYSEKKQGGEENA